VISSISAHAKIVPLVENWAFGADKFPAQNRHIYKKILSKIGRIKEQFAKSDEILRQKSYQST
jgi:hypothetical protein